MNEHNDQQVGEGETVKAESARDSLADASPSSVPSSEEAEQARNVAIDRAMRRSRTQLRPITRDEAAFTTRMGEELMRLRLAADLTRPMLSRMSRVSAAQILQLEQGSTRTRRSTLERLSKHLIHWMDWLDDEGATPAQWQPIHERLVELAGPTIAAERGPNPAKALSSSYSSVTPADSVPADQPLREGRLSASQEAADVEPEGERS